MPSSSRWLLRRVPGRGKTFEVRKDRRHVRYCDDKEQALAYVREHREEGDRVLLEADDGYQENITREVGRARRKHWRR